MTGRKMGDAKAADDGTLPAGVARRRWSLADLLAAAQSGAAAEPAGAAIL